MSIIITGGVRVKDGIAFNGTTFAYQQETLDYQTRVLSDSGYIQDLNVVNDYYLYLNNNNLQSNVKFLTSYDCGIKTASSKVTMMYDLSNNDADIGQAGGSTVQPTLQSVGMYFDGGDTLTRSTVVLGTSASFVVWYSGSGAGTGMIWNHPCDGYITYFDLWWYPNSPWTLYMNTGDGGGNPFKKVSDGQNVTKTDIPNGYWNQFAVILQGSQGINKALLYLDGQLYASASYRNPSSTQQRSFGLGGHPNYKITGLIGEMAIFNITLSAGQISDFYDLTKGKYQ